MNPDRQLQALEALQRSDGWRLVLEQLNADLLDCAKAMASPPGLENNELHYRRGAINELQRLPNIVDRMVHGLRASTALSKQTHESTES